MAVYKLFPRTLIYRGHLSDWGFLFLWSLLSPSAGRGAQCLPQHGLWQPR